MKRGKQKRTQVAHLHGPDKAFPDHAKISVSMAQEFRNVLLCVCHGRLLQQGLARSVSTGELLPEFDLRIDLSVATDGLGMRWGISANTDPNFYDHPEFGKEVLAVDFAKAMAALERHLDEALVAQTKGDPIARRMTASERLARPQLSEQAAVLLFGTKRAFLPWFGWRAADPFALRGDVAREALELFQGTLVGKVTMNQAFGGTPLFLVDTPSPTLARANRAARRSSSLGAVR